MLSNARHCAAKPASIQLHEGASRHIALGAIERAATRRLRLRSPGLQRLPGSLAVRDQEEIQFAGMQRRRVATRRQFVSRGARGPRSSSRAQAPLAHQFAGGAAAYVTRCASLRPRVPLLRPATPCLLHQVRPNPSLVGTATGKALGPRTDQCHHPSRGPSAFPASAPQLKR